MRDAEDDDEGSLTGNLEGRCLRRLEASKKPLEPQATPLQPNSGQRRFFTGISLMTLD
jgi:hypothetical protein